MKLNRFIGRAVLPRFAVLQMAGFLLCFQLLGGCDLIRMKNGNSGESERKAVARVNDVYLYQDELRVLYPPRTHGRTAHPGVWPISIAGSESSY